jgi:hypothetical protein
MTCLHVGNPTAWLLLGVDCCTVSMLLLLLLLLLLLFFYT